MNELQNESGSDCASASPVAESPVAESVGLTLSAVTPKAYDWKVLVSNFKAVGIEVAEEQGTAVLTAVLSFVKEGVFTKQAVLAKAKLVGVELGETLAIAFVKTTLSWVKQSAAQSETKADDILVIILPLVEPKIYEMLDMINPQG